MANVIEVTDGTFEKEIIKSALPAIVDFWADWCMPCKTMAPVIDELAEEFDGRIKVSKINVDKNTETATNLAVMNIPTLIFFKDGQEAGRLSGVVSKDALIRKIQEVF